VLDQRWGQRKDIRNEKGIIFEQNAITELQAIIHGFFYEIKPLSNQTQCYFMAWSRDIYAMLHYLF